MSTHVPGRRDRPRPDDSDPAAEDRRGLASVSPLDTTDVVMMAPVPVLVSVETPVPVEVGQPWTGAVIEADPTTADEIAVLVLQVADVVRLHAGRFGEVATYLPGRRVTGVRLGDDQIEVHVVVAGHVPVRQTAQLIHETVATVVATPVHVFIEDVAVA